MNRKQEILFKKLLPILTEKVVDDMIDRLYSAPTAKPYKKLSFEEKRLIAFEDCCVYTQKQFDKLMTALGVKI